MFSRWVLRSRHSHSVLSYVRCVFPTRTSYGLSGLAVLYPAVLSLVITGLLARITPQSTPRHPQRSFLCTSRYICYEHARQPSTSVQRSAESGARSLALQFFIHGIVFVPEVCKGLFWVATSRWYYRAGEFRFKSQVLSGLSPNSPSSCFLVRDPPSKTAKVARSLRIEYLDLKVSRTCAKGSPD